MTEKLKHEDVIAELLRTSKHHQHLAAQLEQKIIDDVHELVVQAVTAAGHKLMLALFADGQVDFDDVRIGFGILGIQGVRIGPPVDF